MKQSGFFELIGTTIAICMTITLFSGGAYVGGKIINNYRADWLVRQCTVIDAALMVYSQAHTNVLQDSVALKSKKDGGQYVSYQKGPVYPETLEELGIVRDEQGYFVKNIDLSQFDYSVSIAADGTMSYELGVHMPNGAYYKSPRSRGEK